MLAGLEGATKPSLQKLVVLLGDDLTGNANVSMSSCKEDLVTAIEEYTNNMMQNHDYMFNESKDVSADLGYRGIGNSILTKNRF